LRSPSIIRHHTTMADQCSTELALRNWPTRRVNMCWVGAAFGGRGSFNSLLGPDDNAADRAISRSPARGTRDRARLSHPSSQSGTTTANEQRQVTESFPLVDGNGAARKMIPID